MDNVQRGGGVLVKNPVSAPGPPPLSKILDPRLSSTILTHSSESESDTDVESDIEAL